MKKQDFNQLSKELNFLHEIKPNEYIWLGCEVDYLVAFREKEDSCEVIGEICDNEANVHEIPAKVIRYEFQQRFANEIAEIRKEILDEKMNKRLFPYLEGELL